MVETAYPAQLSNRNVHQYIVDGNAATATAVPIALQVGSGRIVAVQASVLTTAPTGASIIVDVNINGTTAFTTQANRPTIAATEFDSTSVLPDVTALADSDIITVDVDQVGSTLPGTDLLVAVVVE